MANLFRLPFVEERAYAEAEKREASLEDRLYAAAFFAEVAARSEEAVEVRCGTFPAPLFLMAARRQWKPSARFWSRTFLRAISVPRSALLSSVAAEGGLPMPGK
ncbi:MAG: hypothetical protein AB1374_12130 [Bacillota bacterium]